MEGNQAHKHSEVFRPFDPSNFPYMGALHLDWISAPIISRHKLQSRVEVQYNWKAHRMTTVSLESLMDIFYSEDIPEEQGKEFRNRGTSASLVSWSNWE